MTWYMDTVLYPHRSHTTQYPSCYEKMGILYCISIYHYTVQYTEILFPHNILNDIFYKKKLSKLSFKDGSTYSTYRNFLQGSAYCPFVEPKPISHLDNSYPVTLKLIWLIWHKSGSIHDLWHCRTKTSVYINIHWHNMISYETSVRTEKFCTKTTELPCRLRVERVSQG